MRINFFTPYSIVPYNQRYQTAAVGSAQECRHSITPPSIAAKDADPVTWCSIQMLGTPSRETNT
jgi:hypothetical protein